MKEEEDKHRDIDDKTDDGRGINTKVRIPEKHYIPGLKGALALFTLLGWPGVQLTGGAEDFDAAFTSL